MEIDFNPNRILKPDLSVPTARPAATRSASEAGAASPSASLEDKLNNLSLVRPEQVARAKELALSVTYPPVELLDRIANLLALRVNQ
jgi:hypothetical protein